MLALLIFALFWAVIATIMLVKNPLPVPDRGHRLFGVPSPDARRVVLAILRDAGQSARLRFRTGPTDQTVLWDGATVIHCLDKSDGDFSGTGISIVVRNPEAAAARALQRLRDSGHSAMRLDGVDADLPSNHLVVITSDAFSGWALAFRRHQLRMPKPQFLAIDE